MLTDPIRADCYLVALRKAPLEDLTGNPGPTPGASYSRCRHSQLGVRNGLGTETRVEPSFSQVSSASSLPADTMICLVDLGMGQ